MSGMAKNESTGEKAGKAASIVLRDDRTGKNARTAAGSALSQRPMSKKGNITLRQAESAVRNYKGKN